MAKFVYAPFTNPVEQIRLVRILPEDENDMLSLELKTFSSLTAEHDQSKQYAALSYAWGTSPSDVVILVNGCSFRVTSTLERGLRCLRSGRYHEREDQFTLLYLWVDAICINQEDLDERNQQVRRMNVIYSMAQDVIIWIGDHIEAADNLHGLEVPTRSSGRLDRTTVLTNMALDALKYVVRCESGADLYEYLQDKWQTSLSVDERIIGQAHPRSTLSNQFTDQHFINVALHIRKLLSRPWFSRLWVIQEIELAACVVVAWGSTIFEWSLLVQAAELFMLRGCDFGPPRLRHYTPQNSFGSVMQIALFTTTSEKTTNFLTLLHHSQYSRCGDPRDRLFALTGLATDVHINANYRWTTEEVYTYWAHSRIRQTGTLDVLAACSDSRIITNIPSWVPQLQSPFGEDFALWSFCFQNYKPWIITTSHPQGGFPDDVQLLVRGHRMSRITAVSNVEESRTSTTYALQRSDPAYIISDARRCIDSWVQWLLQGSSPEKHGHKWTPRSAIDTKKLHTLRKVICRAVSRSPARIDSSLIKEEQMLSQNLNYETWFLNDVDMSDEQKSHLLDGLRTPNNWLMRQIQSCRLFVADNAHQLGIVHGSCSARNEDQVWLLEGALSPMILRPCGQYYSVVSPCYVADELGNVMGMEHEETTLQTITLV